MSAEKVEITPELVLRAYAAGIFPMSEARDDPRTFWVDPERRGILPLDEFHLPRRLKRSFKNGAQDIRVDTCFAAVIKACASESDSRDGTWINQEIAELFTQLHEMGFAHSVEVFVQEELVGGLYGVAMGAAFFGESMFSRRRDASKLALVHLVGRLKIGGFELLDCQFVTDHLSQFGTREVSRETYQRLLYKAIRHSADFGAAGASPSPETILQSITQTS